MKNHEDAQIGGIAQGGVNPAAALMNGQFAGQLQKAVDSQNNTDKERGIEEPFP